MDLQRRGRRHARHSNIAALRPPGCVDSRPGRAGVVHRSKRPRRASTHQTAPTWISTLLAERLHAGDGDGPTVLDAPGDMAHDPARLHVRASIGDVHARAGLAPLRRQARTPACAALKLTNHSADMETLRWSNVGSTAEESTASHKSPRELTARSLQLSAACRVRQSTSDSATRLSTGQGKEK